MKRNIGIISIIVVVLLGFSALIVWKLSSRIDYSQYDLNSVLSGDENSGGIGDNVKGDVNAPVKIFEYADYQCPGCSTANPYINQLVEEYDGKLAVVYRNFLLDYHQNGTAAASAAEAAGLQGYWKDYADLLFANQSDWEYASAYERTNIFVSYFEQITDGQGDVNKFRNDMGSSQVASKIKFDIGAGQYIRVSATPALYINGKMMDFSGATDMENFKKRIREYVDEALKESERKE